MPTALLAVAALTFSADPAADPKAALRELGEFVGRWNGNGESKAKGGPPVWKETFDWSWKFDPSGNAWLALTIEGGRFVSNAELKYDPEAKLYRMTVTEADGNRQQYSGRLTRKGLVLEGQDTAGNVRRVTTDTLADGARMVVRVEMQEGGRGPFADLYKIAATREGESLAGGKKKNECIVTGGLGTIPVSFSGKTYYVCCSGCRDEFEANPKKYVDEFERKKN